MPTHLKRIFSFTLVFVILCSLLTQGFVALADDEIVDPAFSFSFTDIDAENRTFRMNFHVEDTNPDMTSLTLQLVYPTASISYQSIESNYTCTPTPATNRVRFVIADISEFEDGVLFSVLFKVGDSAGDGPFLFSTSTSAAYRSRWYIDGTASGPYIVIEETPVSFISGTISTESVEINSDDFSLKANSAPVPLSATVLPEYASNKAVSWSSSNSGVARVDTSGIVTPITVGTTTITATATDGSGVSDSITVTVRPAVTHVYYKNSDTSKTALAVGSTFALNPVVFPFEADQSGIYHSDNDAVATVDGAGEVTATGVGNTLVWFTSNDGNRSIAMRIWVLPTDDSDAARIGSTSYSTLDAAVTAANNGDTITLLKDQEYGDTLTLPAETSLDLNGKTLYIRQIRIAADTTVSSISNGTIVGIPPTDAEYTTSLYDTSSTIALMQNSTLREITEVTLLHEGGNETVYGAIGMTSDSVIELLANCKITAHWNDDIFDEATGVIHSVSGTIERVENNIVNAPNGVFFSSSRSSAAHAFIYSGTYDARSTHMGSSRITIYGGDFREQPVALWLANGYISTAGSNGFYTVVKGAAQQGELTITITPADATLVLTDSDDQPLQPTSKTGGVHKFTIDVDAEYKYKVSATGHIEKTGSIPISFETTNINISLVETPSEGGATTPTTPETVKGGDFITARGTYNIEKGTSGVITIATQLPVTLVGEGIDSANDVYKELTIDCASGVNLTIRDLWINNNNGQGTSSGPANMGINILKFTGAGNRLTTEGVCLLENQEYVQGAGIHVPPNADLTFLGNGTLYVYKYSAGSGIGGNANEPCGRITFESGTYFIKGSKVGAVIGGDSRGSAKNGLISFTGADVVVIATAKGDAIGESNQATCGGNVNISAGSLTTISDWQGKGIGGFGNLNITGGSYKPVRTGNALQNGSPADKHFVDERAISATIQSNGRPARLLAFDINKLLKDTTATYFTISGIVNYTVERHVDYEYTGANETIASFRENGMDKNLYFYLPLEKDMPLMVNGESFTVSWLADKGEFEVKNASGTTVGGDTSSNTTTTPTEKDVALSTNPDLVVTITPSTTPITNGETTATVAKETLDKAIEEAKEDKKGGIAIAPRNIGDATKVTIELPKASAEALSDAKLSLVVKTPIGDLTFEGDAVKAIVNGAGSGEMVQIIVEVVDESKLPTAQRDAIGDRPAVELSVKSGGVTISSFGNGRVIVTIPYELRDGELAEGLKVFHVAADGTRTEIPCTYNRSISSIVFVVNHFSMYVIDYDATAVWANPFNDVEDTNWFYDAVKFVSSRGLMNGTGENTFAPNANLTRAMLVTVLYRYEGEPAVSGNGGFTDVPSGQWYTDAIAWAAANGIVNGVGDDRFDPNGNITREQLATILHRYTSLKGGDVTATTDLAKFEDATEISTWATDAMKWANAEGLITGRTATTLAPKGTATRAEVATILMRYIQK